MCITHRELVNSFTRGTRSDCREVDKATAPGNLECYTTGDAVRSGGGAPPPGSGLLGCVFLPLSPPTGSAPASGDGMTARAPPLSSDAHGDGDKGWPPTRRDETNVICIISF